MRPTILGSIKIGAAPVFPLAASEVHLKTSLRSTKKLRQVSATPTAMPSAIGLGCVIAAAITALPFGATGVVLALMGLVFVLGFFLDWIEITLIVLPLVEPVTSILGIDKLWFTVLVAVCLQTSFLTPPVGFALFYLKGVAPPEIRLGHLYRGIVPFVLLQLLGLAVLFAFPRLVTWLPEVAWR